MLCDRYYVISCTHWLAAGASMGDSMPLITAKSGMEMLASWALMTFSLFCLTSLQGFCLSFMLIDLKASTFPSYQQTGVILMCTEHFRIIRYINMSYSIVTLWYYFSWSHYWTYYINYTHYAHYLFNWKRLIVGWSYALLAMYSILFSWSSGQHCTYGVCWPWFKTWWWY